VSSGVAKPIDHTPPERPLEHAVGAEADYADEPDRDQHDSLADDCRPVRRAELVTALAVRDCAARALAHERIRPRGIVRIEDCGASAVAKTPPGQATSTRVCFVADAATNARFCFES
jgi:hypothetical protein